MTTNIGTLDRAARMLLGLVLLSLLFALEGAWRWVGLVGFIPLGTALAGWCPAYALFGLSSCPAEERARRA